MTELVPAASNSWTHGSRDSIDHLDVEIAGSGALIDSPSVVFDNHSWDTARVFMGVMKAVLVAFRQFQLLVENCPACGLLGSYPRLASFLWDSCGH